MSPLVISLAAFIGVTALVGGLALLLRGTPEGELEDRLEQLTGRAAGRKPDAMQEGGLAESFKAGQGFFETLMARLGSLSLLFEQANTSLTAAKFFGISGVLAAAAGGIAVYARLHPATIVPMAIAGGLLPLVWLLWRRKRRLKKFAAQLPDALELVARALRAGHSLASGFRLVSDEVPEPLGSEFGRVFEEQNLGIPLDEALQSLSARVPNLDLKFFCTAVVLQRQTGGDLAEILDKIGRLIRERFQVWGQVQALTGEGRLSGIVLLALPPVLFLAVFRLNPDYVTVLFSDPMGKKMLMGALVMQLLGALVIRKIVNIKV